MDVDVEGERAQRPAGEASGAHVVGRPTSKSEVSDAIANNEVKATTPNPARANSFWKKSRTQLLSPDKQLRGKITAFQDKREEERRLMFRAVLRFSLRLFAVGAPMLAVGHCVRVVIASSDGYLLTAFLILCYSVTMAAVVVGSCCPYDQFDLDGVIRRNPKAVGVLATFFAIITAAQVRYFPHMTVVPTCISLLVIVSLLFDACGLDPPRWWPTTTACMVWYLIFGSFSWGGIFFAHQQNGWLPISETPSYILGGIEVAFGVVVSLGWLWHRWQYADLEYGNSVRMYDVLYSWSIVVGFIWVFYGIAWMVYPREGSEDDVGAALELARGFSMMLPSLAVVLVGRNRLFEILGRSFDKDGPRLRRDGAFVAELLETIPVTIGQVWWIHRETEDERYPRFDPRRCWQQGSVTEVTDKPDFAVRLQEPALWEAAGPPPTMGESLMDSSSSRVTATTEVRLPAAGKGESKEDLLLRAQRDLRCVEFENLSPDLMHRVDSRNKPELQAAWHALSRPVLPGERIDYFMSNSWYDNPETKWEKLVEVAEKFRKVHARYPTFWLDKLCIDQQQITDGLRVLPVNVMACNKLLALCGDTYLSRLWCIWELFTLFAFVDEQAALNRIKFVFLGTYEEGMKMLDGMAHFHVTSAHCYDPNEEARLLAVIDAVGTARFNRRISNMAKMTKARLERADREGGGSGSARRLKSTARGLWRSWAARRGRSTSTR